MRYGLSRCLFRKRSGCPKISLKKSRAKPAGNHQLVTRARASDVQWRLRPPRRHPRPSQPPLPDDIEQACIEQCAFWFTNRDRLGLKTHWPSGEAYRQFATQDLLDSVKSTLSHYRRYSI